MQYSNPRRVTNTNVRTTIRVCSQRRYVYLTLTDRANVRVEYGQIGQHRRQPSSCGQPLLVYGLFSALMAEPEHVRATYNDIHDLIKASAQKIAEFKPNMIIAIGMWYCAQRKNESSLDSLRWRVSNVISIYVTNALEMKVPCRGFFPARVMVRTSLESSRKVVSCDLVAYFPERCFYQKEHTNSRHRLVSIRIFARDDRRADWQRSHPDTMAVCVIDHVCLDWYIDIIRLSGPEIGKTLLGRRALIVVSVKSSV